QRAVLLVAAGEDVDRADEVGEGPHVVGPEELLAGHHRREPARGCAGADALAHRVSLHAAQHPLEVPRPVVDAVDRRQVQDPAVDEGQAQVVRGGVRRPGAGLRLDVHDSRWTSASWAVLPAMRSLLTITAAPWASRRMRPREYSVSSR